MSVKSHSRLKLILGIMLLVVITGVLIGWHFCGPKPIPRVARSPLTVWPWPRAVKEMPRPGVTLYTDRSSSIGDTLYLFDFDFAANPNLRLELYDQDEDDAKPFDNHVDFWPRGVGQATRHLNDHGRGRVLAAWNGTFFNSGGQAGGIANHVAPVVLNGKVYFNVGNIRWTVGVKYQDGKPVFHTLHQPDRKAHTAEFTYAAAATQCLIRNGAPLRLEPSPGVKKLRPVPSTPQEAGFVPGVNEIKTSRTSMAWSRDNRHFYLLIVKEPDNETVSFEARVTPRSDDGGWTVADLQHFWQAFGAWGAVNLDGGDVTQLTALRKDGKYLLVPAAWGSQKLEMTYNAHFRGAPQGGTMMYFYVRDSSGK